MSIKQISNSNVTDNRAVKVAAIQMVSGIDLQKNLDRAAHLLEEAARVGAELVVLPENFALFGSENLRSYGEKEETDQRPIRTFLAAQAVKHKIWLFAGTTPRIAASKAGIVAPDPLTYATVHVYSPDGCEVARYDKIHLFDAGVDDAMGRYKESAVIAPGDGLGLVETPYGLVGMGVCYDLRFPEYFRLLQAAGAALFVLPSAFTFLTGEAHWDVLLRARAIENQCAVIAANQGGQHSVSRRTYGHSTIVDSWGEKLAELPGGEGVVIATLDFTKQAELRQKMPVFQHRKFFTQSSV
jgi:nitrilase